MNNVVLTPKQQLEGEIANCRSHLSTLAGKTQAEFEAARLAHNDELRDELLDFHNDVTEAIVIYNRTEIAALDAELPAKNDELRKLNKSMADRMAQNKKIAQQLTAFAGIIGGVTSLGGQILKA